MERIPVQVERQVLRVEDVSVVEVDSAPAAMEDVRHGSGGGRVYETRQVMRRQQVVRVEKHKQLALRERDAVIAGGRNTTFARAGDGDSPGKPAEHLRRAVGRSVVDHDQLRGDVLLVEHALDRVGDELFAVPDGDDDRY